MGRFVNLHRLRLLEKIILWICQQLLTGIYLRSLTVPPYNTWRTINIFKFKHTFWPKNSLHYILFLILLRVGEIAGYRRAYHTSILCTIFSSTSSTIVSRQTNHLCKAAIMKFLGLAYLAVLLGVSSATEQMQINYYSNSGCSDYIGQVDVTWATVYGGSPNCFNYNYGNSVNIANCYEDHCICYFYPQENCGGNGAFIVTSPTNQVNCLAGSSSYNSFACYYWSWYGWSASIWGFEGQIWIRFWMDASNGVY
jgi:hypothetical protein